MDITPPVSASQQLIKAYGKGVFTVNDTVWEENILVFPEHTMRWNIAKEEGISSDSFDAVLTHTPLPELLLVGTGELMQRLEKPITEKLKAAGIAVEIMDTGAACRTYNVLISEERRVAAALIAV